MNTPSLPQEAVLTDLLVLACQCGAAVTESGSGRGVVTFEFTELTRFAARLAAPVAQQEAVTNEMLDEAIERQHLALMAGRTARYAMKRAIEAALASSPPAAPKDTTP